MARRPVKKEETISVEAAGEILRAAERIRKSAFMAGYKYLENIDLEDEFFAEHAEEAYKEWVKSLG